MSLAEHTSPRQVTDPAIFTEAVDPELLASETASFSTPLSSDDMVDQDDIQHLHQIISDSHLEDSEEQESDSSVSTKLPVLTLNIWDIVRRGAINLVLPFINGVMLGFGEILAHEIGFRYGFVGARVQPPRRLEERRRSKFL